MDFNAVAAELKRRAGTAGLSVAGKRIVPYDHVPDAIETPAFVVAEFDIEYDKTFRRGDDEVVVTCRIFTARTDDATGQRLLREFMASGGTTAIKVALEAKPRHVSEVWDDLRVQRARGNRLFVYGEQRYYGIELEVKIVGDGG